MALSRAPSSFDEVLEHSALRLPFPSAQLAPMLPPPPVDGVGVGWGVLATGGVESDGEPPPHDSVSDTTPRRAPAARGTHEPPLIPPWGRPTDSKADGCTRDVTVPGSHSPHPHRTDGHGRGEVADRQSHKLQYVRVSLRTEHSGQRPAAGSTARLSRPPLEPWCAPRRACGRRRGGTSLWIANGRRRLDLQNPLHGRTFVVEYARHGLPHQRLRIARGKRLELQRLAGAGRAHAGKHDPELRRHVREQSAEPRIAGWRRALANHVGLVDQEHQSDRLPRAARELIDHAAQVASEIGRRVRALPAAELQLCERARTHRRPPATASSIARGRDLAP